MKRTITDPKAVLAYTTAMVKTTIYQNPRDYLLVCTGLLTGCAGAELYNSVQHAQFEKICKIPHNTEMFTRNLIKTRISIEYQDF